MYPLPTKFLESERVWPELEFFSYGIGKRDVMAAPEAILGPLGACARSIKHKAGDGILVHTGQDERPMEPELRCGIDSVTHAGQVAWGSCMRAAELAACPRRTPLATKMGRVGRVIRAGLSQTLQWRKPPCHNELIDGWEESCAFASAVGDVAVAGYSADSCVHIQCLSGVWARSEQPRTHATAQYIVSRM